jgi:bifunctional non-homologous end joining protein LigD
MPTESTTLYYREGHSDKVYQAEVSEQDGGFVVNFAYGRRGSTLQTGTKTFAPVPFDEAKKIYDKLVKEKTSKGYSPRANGTPYAGTENAQRSTGILPQLLNPIDEAQVEKLIADPAYWMQQKYDGKRVIIHVGDAIAGINRKGLTIALPQSIAESAAAIRSPCILDGEAVGDRYFAFDQLKRANAEGVVFKGVDAPYTPGRPASGGPQLKFKFVASGTFIVAGVNAGKRSVGLEVLNAGQPQYVGNVTVPPNQKVPKPGAPVEVRYPYCFREGCLYQPVYLGVRDDVDASACTITQLKYRPEENDDGE